MQSEPVKDPLWLTNYEEAQKQAREGNKLLLMDFTGSDWCPPCIVLKREVFSKPAFKSYAEKNLVLLEVDFPRGKQLSDAERVQNQQLMMEFGIRAFPTLVVLDSGGEIVAQLGVDAAIPPDAQVFRLSPEAFIARLENLRRRQASVR